MIQGYYTAWACRLDAEYCEFTEDFCLLHKPEHTLAMQLGMRRNAHRAVEACNATHNGAGQNSQR